MLSSLKTIGKIITLLLPIVVASDAHVKTGKVISIYPTKLSEITEGPYENFIIKFGASYCGPCRQLDSLLSRKVWDLKNNVCIYMMVLNGNQNELISELRKHYRFSGIPFSVLTDKTFEIKKTFAGYNEHSFINFVYSNFQ